MKRILFVSLALWSACVYAIPVYAQGIGNSGTITGTVIDPSGAVIPGATVEVENKVSGYDKTVKTDANGEFKFLGVPQNTYHNTVSPRPASRRTSQDVDVRTTVPSISRLCSGAPSSTTR